MGRVSMPSYGVRQFASACDVHAWTLKTYCKTPSTLPLYPVYRTARGPDANEATLKTLNEELELVKQLYYLYNNINFFVNLLILLFEY